MSLFPILLFGLLLAVIAIGAYGIFLYNGLIYLRNQMGKAWANIDVLLKQRHDMIPNLVETVKGYAAHERATFEAVTNARAAAMSSRTQGSAAAPEVARAENALADTLKTLFAVAEAYPNLKASENFLQLQETLVRIENEIAERREFFNNAVNLYNIGIQRLPDVFVARFLHFQPAVYFKADDDDRAPVNAQFSPPTT